jgi:hypothetical protein
MLEFQGVWKGPTMTDPIRAMLQAARKSWFAATAKKRAAGETTAPAHFLHDPAARRPHDLDDPFFVGAV